MAWQVRAAEAHGVKVPPELTEEGVMETIVRPGAVNLAQVFLTPRRLSAGEGCSH